MDDGLDTAAGGRREQLAVLAVLSQDISSASWLMTSRSCYSGQNCTTPASIHHYPSSSFYSSNLQYLISNILFLLPVLFLLLLPLPLLLSWLRYPSVHWRLPGYRSQSPARSHPSPPPPPLPSPLPPTSTATFPTPTFHFSPSCNDTHMVSTIRTFQKLLWKLFTVKLSTNSTN